MVIFLALYICKSGKSQVRNGGINQGNEERVKLWSE